MYRIQLDRKKILKVLSLIAAFLLSMHAVLVTYNYIIEEVPWYFLQLFDVNEEHNLPTWFSGFNLIVATFLLGVITMEKRNLSDAMKGRWTILFAGFCFLSIDEIAGLHESVNSVVDVSWAWGGLVIAAGLAVYFLPFLKTLPRPTFRDFVVAGFVFVGGAVGMELVGEPIDGDSLAYNLSTLVEEGMEIFGIILFTRALLMFMKNEKGETVLELNV